MWSKNNIYIIAVIYVHTNYQIWLHLSRKFQGKLAWMKFLYRVLSIKLFRSCMIISFFRYFRIQYGFTVEKIYFVALKSSWKKSKMHFTILLYESPPIICTYFARVYNNIFLNNNINLIYNIVTPHVARSWSFKISLVKFFLHI